MSEPIHVRRTEALPFGTDIHHIISAASTRGGKERYLQGVQGLVADLLHGLRQEQKIGEQQRKTGIFFPLFASGESRDAENGSLGQMIQTGSHHLAKAMEALLVYTS